MTLTIVKGQRMTRDVPKIHLHVAGTLSNQQTTTAYYRCVVEVNV